NWELGGVWTIAGGESTPPPGVSSGKTPATSLASSARRMLSVIYSTTTGLMTPSTWCTLITVSAPIVTGTHHNHSPQNTRHSDKIRTAIRLPIFSETTAHRATYSFQYQQCTGRRCGKQ